MINILAPTSLAKSISASVTSEVARLSLTASEVSFDVFKVVTNSSSSSKDPRVSFNRRRSSSSKLINSRLPTIQNYNHVYRQKKLIPCAMVVTSTAFCSSNCACSLRTTIANNCSSKPCSFTAKFTTFVLVETSGA